MRTREDKHTPIIVKRRSKRGHNEHQSGAWKVAFADFALAMMALFMVLWVIQPQADAERIAKGVLASSVIEGGAGVFDDLSPVPVAFESLPEFDWVPRRQDVQLSDSRSEAVQRYDSEADLQALARLMALLAESTDSKSNLEVHVVPQGLRILIKDDDKRFMFERGSATLDPHFRTLLTALAQELAKVQNKLIVSGHTDAAPYRDSRGYDNWNLSGERALQARSVLVNAGLPAHGILQVSAQADVMPLRPEEPLSGANRRIELLVLTEQAETLYRQLFSENFARYSPGAVDYVQPVTEPADKPR